jgi:hypothetical protein
MRKLLICSIYLLQLLKIDIFAIYAWFSLRIWTFQFELHQLVFFKLFISCAYRYFM